MKVVKSLVFGGKEFDGFIHRTHRSKKGKVKTYKSISSKMKKHLIERERIKDLEQI